VSAPASFYFDLASPEAYLAAERVLHVLPRPAEWRPVLAAGLAGTERSGALRGEGGEQGSRAEIARRAQELGLQPLRWPDPFPFDSALAMRVATYAESIGRVVPFAQAAFRQAFAGGHSLGEPDRVLIAAAACEMHPTAVLAGARLRSIGRELSRSTAEAARAGVLGVPAILVGERVFLGDSAVEDAAAHMVATARADPPARLEATATEGGAR
jgi:2-hydroxychromene-2-carboxylate isomerase